MSQEEENTPTRPNVGTVVDRLVDSGQFYVITIWDYEIQAQGHAAQPTIAWLNDNTDIVKPLSFQDGFLKGRAKVEGLEVAITLTLPQ